MPSEQTSGPTRAWVEVDAAALRANLEAVRARVGAHARLIPMVKANGYGLGAVRVARALEPLAWGFGVATAEEGAELRAAGIEAPILVAGPLPVGAEALAVRARLTPSVSDLAGVEALAAAAGAAGRRLDVHVEVDTGMGRCGFDWRDARTWGPAVLEAAGEALRWTGVYTHFQGADAPAAEPTLTQWERFREALSALESGVGERLAAAGHGDGGSGALPLLVHAANSAAALRFPELAGDAVRPGIFLYGGVPAEGLAPGTGPRPVASVRARVLLVREVPAGSTVGYGATHRADGPRVWGTLGIGYGDGLPRGLGNRGGALVRGRRVPIVGRVSMDLTVVDLTDVPEARRGDVATLIGKDGGEEITVEDVAALAGTISYDVLTGLTARLPRVDEPPALGQPHAAPALEAHGGRR